MLKKVSIDQLRPGMYVHELGGSWIDHSFWRTKFKIAGLADLQKMREAGLREVVIDTDKGLDVAPMAPQPATAPERAPAAALPPPAPVRTTVREELTRATAITAQAKKAVFHMFANARMGKAIQAETMQPLVHEINESVIRNPHALVTLARLKTKDDYTYLHSVAVCGLMTSLARMMKLPEDLVHNIGLGGLLHDVGKARIADTILNKPGKLTDDEFAVIKTHPTAGHRMLLESGFDDALALDVCLHHHEKMDGSGYPDKLAGEAIPLYARMGAVCDVYDAVTSTRPYNNGWDPGETIRRMSSWKGHFDERILHAFIRCLGIYPIGSLVRLHSERIGVVVEQGEKSLLEPVIKAFYSVKSDSYIRPVRVDLSRSPDRIANIEDPAKWHFKDLDKMWMDGEM